DVSADFRRRNDARCDGLISELPEDPIFVFTANTIEVAAEVFGLERLKRFGICVVEADYEASIRNECHFAKLRQQAGKRVNRLRHEVSDGLQSGAYELLPQMSPDIASK